MGRSLTKCIAAKTSETCTKTTESECRFVRQSRETFQTCQLHSDIVQFTFLTLKNTTETVTYHVTYFCFVEIFCNPGTFHALKKIDEWKKAIKDWLRPTEIQRAYGKREGVLGHQRHG